jgi:hypothetical protein
LSGNQQVVLLLPNPGLGYSDSHLCQLGCS